ncbi:hypothetical protein PGT21_014005 [Puccinia graminis f. sp. tritici]|uniref:Uncharacterized protein n=1 Tax=Puccinia graminis f. sp. tritici TaxID=56615 RepID=A0A5B0NQK2_PUCGR|nr:hypothetical protein PGT21_014005 [Puccinia graminis f. sp. tritici]
MLKVGGKEKEEFLGPVGPWSSSKSVTLASESLFVDISIDLGPLWMHDVLQLPSKGPQKSAVVIRP